MVTGTLLKGTATHIAIYNNYYFIGFLIVKCRVFIRHWRLENSPFTSRNSPANVQVWVVQKMDIAIYRINHYPSDKYLGNQVCYPVGTDLSGG